MRVARRDGHNVGPAVGLAHAQRCVAQYRHAAVLVEQNGCPVAGRYGNDVSVALYVALAAAIDTGCQYGSVRPQTNGMILACGDGNDSAASC